MSVVQYLDLLSVSGKNCGFQKLRIPTCFDSGLCHLLANKQLERRADNSFNIPLRSQAAQAQNVNKLFNSDIVT